MTATPPPLTIAFRDLERALTRRRWAALGRVVQVELAAIALLIAAFCAWQVRIPLDGMARNAGSGTAAFVVALLLAALAALAAVAVAARYSGRLRSGARPGPGAAWLALPIPPRVLERHLRWDARRIAGWALVPALGVVAAAIGLVPASRLVPLAAGFALALWAAARGGAALGFELARRWLPPPPPGARAARLHPVERALAVAPAGTASRLTPARWRRLPAWWALALKDLLLSRRPTPAQGRARNALIVMVLSALAWRLPAPPGVARSAAYVLALAAGVTLAEWLAELGGADPFAVLRTLPVGLTSLWLARAVAAALGAALLVALNALAFPALPAGLERAFLAWAAGAAFALGLLGAQLGLSLAPRADHAQRVLGVTLGVVAAASLMMPLLGWLVLLAALVHSATRLPGFMRRAAA